MLNNVKNVRGQLQQPQQQQYSNNRIIQQTIQQQNYNNGVRNAAGTASRRKREIKEGECCYMECCCQTDSCKSCSNACPVNLLSPCIIPFYVIFVLLIFSFAIPASVNQFTAAGQIIEPDYKCGNCQLRRTRVGGNYCGFCNPEVQYNLNDAERQEIGTPERKCEKDFIFEPQDGVNIIQNTMKHCQFPMQKCSLNESAISSIFIFCFVGMVYLVISCFGCCETREGTCCCCGTAKVSIKTKRKFKYVTMLLFLTFVFNVLSLYTFMNNIGTKQVERYPTLRYHKPTYIYDSKLRRNIQNGSTIQIAQLPSKLWPNGDLLYEYQMYENMPCQSISDYDLLRQKCMEIASNVDDDGFKISGVRGRCMYIRANEYWIATYVFLWLTFVILLIYFLASCFYLCCKKIKKNDGNDECDKNQNLGVAMQYHNNNNTNNNMMMMQQPPPIMQNDGFHTTQPIVQATSQPMMTMPQHPIAQALPTTINMNNNNNNNNGMPPVMTIVNNLQPISTNNMINTTPGMMKMTSPDAEVDDDGGNDKW